MSDTKKRQKIRKGVILFSFFLFPAIYYYLSPVLIIRAASKGIVNGSFIIFLLLFMSSLFLGRAWCGWLCPAAGCQEAIFLSRDKKIKRGDIIKWIIWVPWIGTIIYFAFKAGGYSKIDFLYMTKFGLSIGNVYALITYFFVLLLLIVFPGFIVGKRSFCHHLCWMAPFMISGRKVRNIFNWPSLKLNSKPDKCTHCFTCEKYCPMSLPVETMVNEGKMENPECILCGSCVDGCRHEAIKYGFFSK